MNAPVPEARRSCRCFLVRAAAAAVLLICVSAFQGRAQGLELSLKNLGASELAYGFLRPGADALGFAINSGLSRTALVEEGFHITFGVRGIWTLIPQGDRTYTATLPKELVLRGYPSQFTTATVVGDRGATIASQDVALPPITMPHGVNTGSLSIMIPNVTIGAVAGTELILRGLPNLKIDDAIGKVSFIGAGLKNNFTSYTRKPFIDLAVMGMYQYMNVDGEFSEQSFSFNLQASKKLSIFTPFAMIGYEGYSIDVAYDYVSPVVVPPGVNIDDRVELSFRGRNLRMTVGGSVQLLRVLSLMADYSFGVQDNAVVGLDFTF